MLLADANVIIDFALVQGVHALTMLEPLEILDVIVQEAAVDERLPDLQKTLQNAGVRVIAVEHDWSEQMQRLRTGRLSAPDGWCLYYAKTFKRTLLTADKPLRLQCDEHRVLVHGHLWVVEQLFSQRLATAPQLCQWLEFWVQDGSRFPKQELEQLRQRLGCLV